MYTRRKPVEDIPLAETEVWACLGAGCNRWMRIDFAFEAEPDCPQCRSPMKLETRLLPVLENPYPTLRRAADCAKLSPT